MVTLAIHKMVRRWLFRSVETSNLDLERRGVLTSQGSKEAVIENMAFNLMKKRADGNCGAVQVENKLFVQKQTIC